ncbi:PREDICTED: secretory phospholipase A2 receptor-like [Cyprinodon variegatus]|uniref:secretory phospholipase A2 receptor-like n=1 Tax=Cyprinodon variegatus TaxID=28743 RepID=UPI000742A957|nr:PREDICTED: secretory phospholipase A2 receptor-like [Cyprinodon variegatus]
MGKMLLGLLFLLDWVVLSTCILPQYYFVNKLLNWTEAQTYCRQMNADLATILNSEEQNQLIQTLTSAGHHSNVWFGLFNEIDWKWSDGYTGNGSDYRNWRVNHPTRHDLNELCVGSHYNGGWFDADCAGHRHFLCYKGSHLDPEFVYVNTLLNWSNAQIYCRENFVDLATIKDYTEYQQVQRLIPTYHHSWIGLYRDPNLHWSNGSSVLFTNWDTYGIFIGSRTVICGATSTQRSGRWRFLHCETRLPFVCYGPSAIKKIVKLRLQSEDSVDLNDPVQRGNILKKLQKNLQENGVSGVTLRWSEQPDGKVFKKEKKEL